LIGIQGSNRIKNKLSNESPTTKENQVDNEENTNEENTSKTDKVVVGGTVMLVTVFLLEPLVEKGVKFAKAYLKNR